MNKIVLDASALLALLNQEPGSEKLTPELLRVATTSRRKSGSPNNPRRETVEAPGYTGYTVEAPGYTGYTVEAPGFSQGSGALRRRENARHERSWASAPVATFFQRQGALPTLP